MRGVECSKSKSKTKKMRNKKQQQQQQTAKAAALRKPTGDLLCDIEIHGARAHCASSSNLLKIKILNLFMRIVLHLHSIPLALTHIHVNACTACEFSNFQFPF